MPGTHDDRPTVSVLMMTYNHGRYVEHALRSVFAQELDGRVQLVICDDASPDDTQAVISAVTKESPHELEVILRPRNIGGHANFSDAWSRCTGRYIALLEGDDFWCHPGKLAAQVERLDNRPSATLSFHRVGAVGADGDARPETWPQDEVPAYDLAALVRGNFAQTCSVVYRAGTVPAFPAWVHDLPMGDWPLNLLHAIRGDLDFIDLDAARYRFHPGGIWSGRSRSRQLLASAKVLRLVARRGGATTTQVRLMRRRATELRFRGLVGAARERLPSSRQPHAPPAHS